MNKTRQRMSKTRQLKGKPLKKKTHIWSFEHDNNKQQASVQVLISPSTPVVPSTSTIFVPTTFKPHSNGRTATLQRANSKWIHQHNRYLESICTSTSVDSTIITELSVRLSAIKPLLDKFNSVQLEIESLTQDLDDLANEQERESFESAYFSLISKAEHLLAENAPASSIQVQSTPVSANSSFDLGSNQSQSVKLPTIQLPTFSGNYEKWLEFRDTFNSLIHNNKTISDIEKLHYLKASLIGDAMEVIQSLDLSADNYLVAWDLLIQRYDNKRLIVHNHIKAIFNLPNLTKESPALLRQILDGLSKHLRCLKALKQPTNDWGMLLIYTIANKLDPLSKREWESYKISGEFPTVDELLTFLKNKCELLETLNIAQVNSSNNALSKSKSVKGEREAKSFVTTNNDSNNNKGNRVQCAYCKQSHLIYNCETFKQLPVNSRIDETKRLKLCINCLRTHHFTKECKSTSLCKLCGKKHHTLLHLTTQAPTIDETNSENKDKNPSTPSSTLTNHSLGSYSAQTLLSTFMIRIQDDVGNFHECRALLDNGSQSSFISRELCDRLKLKTTKINLTVTGINQLSSNISDKTFIKILSNKNNYNNNIPCIVVPHITGNIPSFSFNVQSLQIPKNIQLADPQFNVPRKIDLLLGGNIFWELICTGRINLGPGQPVLQKTVFGWVLGGPLNFHYNIPETTRCHLTVCENNDSKFLEQLKNFWQIEDLHPKTKPLSRDEQFCENYFQNTTYQQEDGRFVVSIPLKESLDKLGESKERALERFLSLERKFEKNNNLKEKYVAFMTEYEQLGHMTKLTNENSQGPVYYMPHHGVFKNDDKKKLRVVFDASAKTSSGLSFNDIQYVGPTIQDDLFSILIRFRKHTYVYSADVEKMYRMVIINKEQRSLQRILWRADSNGSIETYELNTVTYGTASAPFLAIRSLHEIAFENKSNYPVASSVILKDFYVDDLLSGSNTVAQAIKTANEINQVLRKRGFHLAKWKSNNSEILKHVAFNESQPSPLQIGSDDYTKTLGLLWSSDSDTLTYSQKEFRQPNTITKRAILSITASIFDPLGLLGCCIIIPKIILQRLWSYKLTWDESIPTDLHTLWSRFYSQLRFLGKIRISRHITVAKPVRIELHGFSDASQSAYGACVYIRSTDASDNVLTSLVCAKSRVAPLKTISIPKLKLCAALLLAQLVERVKLAIDLEFQNTIYWCDSTIVLGWIKTSPSSLKTFVANRISEIQNLTPPDSWRHVKSAENPADLLSRGIYPKDLLNANLWWSGPSWLSEKSYEWSTNQSLELPNDLPETRSRSTALVSVENTWDIFHRYSSLTKLQRVVAYCIRFKFNATPKRVNRNYQNLSVEELDHALNVLIKVAQTIAFGEEISNLKNNKPLNPRSKLLSLNPFIDENGLLRVGGRLQNSNFEFNKKHPILLPHDHVLTELIGRHYHIKAMHAGPQALLSFIREKYWPISGRNLVKRLVRNCVICFRAKPANYNPLMGSLPANRVSISSPFQNCGVDYAGPFILKDKKGRGCKHIKGYVCVFICFTTKAMHFELVSDLSAEAFTASLRRFVSRRGKPSHIHSDNATNFKGADSELKQFVEFINSSQVKTKIENCLSMEGISWHYIPPRAPNFGGLWEAGVKSLKFHLKRVVGNTPLTFEEFYTVLTQIEAIANSRPLSPLSSDPTDFQPLTPAHFLIGRSLISVPDANVQDIPDNRLSRYQLLQKMVQDLWARWSKEYISEMQTRQKWKREHPNLVKEGVLVLIKDTNLPPLKWRLGRVLEVHPGADGISRVVTVKLQNDVIVRRAITGVCVLPQ